MQIWIAFSTPTHHLVSFSLPIFQTLLSLISPYLVLSGVNRFMPVSHAAPRILPPLFSVGLSFSRSLSIFHNVTIFLSDCHWVYFSLIVSWSIIFFAFHAVPLIILSSRCLSLSLYSDLSLSHTLLYIHSLYQFSLTHTLNLPSLSSFFFISSQ